MIIDHINNAARYYFAHPKFGKVLKRLEQVYYNFNKFHESQDSLISIYFDLEARERCCLFEYHKRHVDIHMCIKGVEIIEYSTSLITIEQKNEDSDFFMANGEYSGEIRLTEGQFVIFFTNELHKPQIGNAGQRISKCVAKIEVKN